MRGGNAPSVRNGLLCPEVGAQGRNPALDGPAGLAYYEVALETRGTEHRHAPPPSRKPSGLGLPPEQPSDDGDKPQRSAATVGDAVWRLVGRKSSARS